MKNLYILLIVNNRVNCQQKDISNIYFLLDKEGVEELIDALNYIKNNNESLHLVLGEELNEDPFIIGNSIVEHVKLIYLDEDKI